MRWRIFLILVFSVFLINFTCAEFSFSDTGSSINTEYGISDYLKAKVNISFQDEPLNSTFRDSLGNSINLSLLLTKIPNFSYIINQTTNKITSNFHVIQLDVANFSMPDTIGTFNYQLNFSGRQIFKEEIKVISIDKSIEEAIKEKYEILNNSRAEIKKLDVSVQKVLNERLNISSLENKLNTLENQYESASSEEYEEILANLSEIKIPSTISEIAEANSISFYPKKENIDLDALKTIAGGDYPIDQENEYIDGLILWYQDSLKTKLTFKEMSVLYDSNEERILRIFKFKFDKRDLKNEAYFIIEDLGDIVFDEDYSLDNAEGYIYLNLKDISGELLLSTEQYVDFLSIPVFIAPSINDISPLEAGTYIDAQKENKISKWVLFGLILFLLLLIGVVAYIIIQAWYKRKYENYLFKNRNNLFNIMAYIQNAKKRGMPREDIIKNLKKSNWKKEQINYALNKYEGKKIAGIIERPFKRVLENIEKSSQK